MLTAVPAERRLHRGLVRSYSLPSLLHVRSHELLGVLLEHLVDLVQDRVDVLGHFLVPLGDLGVDRRLDLVGLLARSGRPLLPAGVPRGHAALRSCSWLVLPVKVPARYDIHGSARRGFVDHPPVMVSTSSCAEDVDSNSAPTWSRVPRSGSIVGIRTRFSRPRSNTTESHDAAATWAG